MHLCTLSLIARTNTELATGESLSAYHMHTRSRIAQERYIHCKKTGPIHFHLQSDCWHLLPPELLRTSGDSSKFNVY